MEEASKISQMEETNYIPTVQEAIDNVSSDTIMAASSQTAAITGDLQTAVERHRPAPQYIRRQPTLYREHKVGRNDKCPCGSGKKYKDCCLESGRFEGYTMQRIS